MWEVLVPISFALLVVLLLREIPAVKKLSTYVLIGIGAAIALAFAFGTKANANEHTAFLVSMWVVATAIAPLRMKRTVAPRKILNCGTKPLPGRGTRLPIWQKTLRSTLPPTIHLSPILDSQRTGRLLNGSETGSVLGTHTSKESNLRTWTGRY